MLASWRKDVSQYLSEEAAAAGIHGRHKGYVSIAWRFLNAGGYINFGVGEGILRRVAGVEANKGCVIVVGAGLAGVLPELLSERFYRVIEVRAVQWRHCIVLTSIVAVFRSWTCVCLLRM